MPRSLPSQTSAQDFAAFSRAIQSVDPITKNEALDNTAGTNWTWKDILTSAAYGGVIRW